MTATHSDKAALRGEPSYVWRDGQQRRLQMILDAAGERSYGSILENGCGLGSYMLRLQTSENYTIGLDVEFDRTVEAHQKNVRILCGAGEYLPFPTQSFDLILSNEVIEHVQDVMDSKHTVFSGTEITISATSPL
jgi:2-polyprenyl-3-methyl-5-hydroxy-6-metoxy-1,4-benzoquinol methylase